MVSPSCSGMLLTFDYTCTTHSQHSLLSKQQGATHKQFVPISTRAYIHFCNTQQIPVVEGDLQSGNYGNEVIKQTNPDPHWRELKEKSHSKALNPKLLLSRGLMMASWPRSGNKLLPHNSLIKPYSSTQFKESVSMSCSQLQPSTQQWQKSVRCSGTCV